MPGDLIQDLRTINDEVERAYHSWAIFWQSMRELSLQYDEIIEAFDNQEIGPTVNHIQLVLLHDCVAGICRVTDEHKPDRVTLNSAMHKLRSAFAKRFPDEVKAVERLRKEIVKSDSLTELRVFRNSQIGHTLRTEPPPTTYHSIPILIDQLFTFLEAAFRLSGDARWIGQMTNKRKEELAKRFWDCIEYGAQATFDEGEKL